MAKPAAQGTYKRERSVISLFAVPSALLPLILTTTRLTTSGTSENNGPMLYRTPKTVTWSHITQRRLRDPYRVFVVHLLLVRVQLDPIHLHLSLARSWFRRQTNKRWPSPGNRRYEAQARRRPFLVWSLQRPTGPNLRDLILEFSMGLFILSSLIGVRTRSSTSNVYRDEPNRLEAPSLQLPSRKWPKRRLETF